MSTLTIDIGFAIIKHAKCMSLCYGLAFLILPVMIYALRTYLVVLLYVRNDVFH